MNKKINECVSSILNGADVSAVIKEGKLLGEGKLVNEGVKASQVEKLLKMLKPGFDSTDLAKAIKKAGLQDMEDELTEIIIEIDDDGELSDALSDPREIKMIAKSIAEDYFEECAKAAGSVLKEEEENLAEAVLAAIKTLKPGFSVEDLEEALAGVIEDVEAAEALVEYFSELEEEDGLVSSHLNGDITDAEMMAAINNFIEDIVEGVEAVNENDKQLAKKVSKEIAKLDADEFIGSELEAALKKAGLKGDELEAMYDFLSEIEEEEGELSAFISGDISAKEFEETLVSFLED